MRTNEERICLIHNRTKQIKREEQKMQQHLWESLCTAACLLLVAGIGMWMPALIEGTRGESISYVTGAASMIGNNEALGYILIGLLAFLLGVCLTVFLYRLRFRNERRRQEDEKDEF